MAEWARPMMHVTNDLAAWRLDAAEIAYRLRGLSVDTHRTLKRQDASSDELTELSRRIDELRKQTQDPRFLEIDRWLESTQNLIERRKRSA
jgi:hypothetical protein